MNTTKESFSNMKKQRAKKSEMIGITVTGYIVHPKLNQLGDGSSTILTKSGKKFIKRH